MEKVKNEVRFTVCGIEYNILTDEGVDYTKMLAQQIDEKMSYYLNGNPFVNRNRASVLALLDFVDQLHKAQEEIETLHSQLNEYLEDATKAKSERDYYKRELERYKTETKFKGGQINLFAKAGEENNE